MRLPQNGLVEVHDILRQRLDRRRTQWAGKDIPQAEGKLEGELVQAVILEKEWQMSDMPVGALRQSCISSPGSARSAQGPCRQHDNDPGGVRPGNGN